MDKWRPYIVFIILMAFYFCVRYLRLHVDGLPTFVRFYLTDLLFVPAMATIGLIVVRIVKQNNTLIISPGLLFFQTALISVFFEWYLPTYKSRPGWYTSDPWDVFMYILGAFLYLLIQHTLFRQKSRERA